MRSPTIGDCCGRLWTGRAPTPGVAKGRRAHRSQRLLGVAGHRGLELPDAHASQRRFHFRSAKPGRAQSGGEWNPSKDEAAGEQCRAYGADGIMRIPGRLHISWQDGNTLKLETDAGTETRMFYFGASEPRW